MIQFYKTNFDGTQEKLGQASLSTEGRVNFRNVPPTIVSELIEFGILYGGKRFFPEDGQAFLDLLPAEYSGSIVRAQKV